MTPEPGMCSNCWRPAARDHEGWWHTAGDCYFVLAVFVPEGEAR